LDKNNAFTQSIKTMAKVKKIFISPSFAMLNFGYLLKSEGKGSFMDLKRGMCPERHQILGRDGLFSGVL
jgi:hypothetical protein